MNSLARLLPPHGAGETPNETRRCPATFASRTPASLFPLPLAPLVPVCLLSLLPPVQLPVQVQAITPPLLSSPSLHSNAPRPPPLYKGELHITTLPTPSRQPPHLSSSFPGAISSPKGPFLFLISLLSSIHPSIRPSFLGNNISSYLSGRCLPCACVCVCIVDVPLMILVERWWARSRLSEFCVCCLVLKLGGEMLSLLMRPRNARVSSFVALKFRGKFGRCVSASFDMNFRDGERGWFLISIFSWHADKIS